jgi:hypothetical protein
MVRPAALLNFPLHFISSYLRNTIRRLFGWRSLNRKRLLVKIFSQSTSGAALIRFKLLHMCIKTNGLVRVGSSEI